MICKQRSDEQDAADPFPAFSLDACDDFQAFQRWEPAQPEKRLMLAMLEDALRCREKYRDAEDRRGKKLFREAEEWLLADTDWIFSIGNVCEALGLNSAYIRKCALHDLRRSPRRGLKGEVPGEASGMARSALRERPLRRFPIEARL
jgi:hypothetical protein